MNLLANGWPSALDKAEGLAIINDSTIAICNDNDFGVASPNADGIATATGNTSHVLVYGLKGVNKIPNFQALAALPLHISSFTGNLVNGRTILGWTTANEVNTGLYEIERSGDGINFSKIVVVQAAGRGTNEYQSSDAQPQAGKNYYRLKVVDKDGKFVYSAVLLIRTDTGKISYTLYPNPVKDQLIVSMTGAAGTQVNIYNQQGQQVFRRQITASSAAVSLAHLPKGIYVVQLASAGATEVHKLVKH